MAVAAATSGREQGTHARRPARRRATIETAQRDTAPAVEANRATTTRATTTRRHRVAQIDRPAVAPCPNLDDLRTLEPEAARTYVNAYLHEVMPARQANDFEAWRYRWELHLVELDQLCLLRSVDLSKRKLGHYRAILRKHSGFPPLIGLGGDGRDVTRGVLLCDGYHRAIAMRDVGMHFAWIWLAVAPWAAASTPPALATAHNG